MTINNNAPDNTAGSESSEDIALQERLNVLEAQLRIAEARRPKNYRVETGTLIRTCRVVSAVSIVGLAVIGVYNTFFNSAE